MSEASVVHVCVAPVHRIRVRGRVVQFELPFGGYVGPVVVGKRGEPLARQPGARSPFWRAFAKWERRNRRGA